jgi:D-alanine-D-alanine ligase
VRSAASVKAALDANRYEVADLFISKEGKWTPAPLSPEPGGNPGIDVVFPMLHGTFGEDGTVQGLLELAALPYVSAGVLASAVSMDKAMTKRLCQHAELPVVEYVVVTRTCIEFGPISPPFDYPVFVKPANLGSSVGISKVRTAAELMDALRLAARFDNAVIVERGVNGREFECAVLGGNPPKASVPCEIVPSQEFYSYEDKYLLDRARIDLPAKLSDEQTAEMQRLAVAAFQAVNCECMARVDFLMDGATGQFYINEINTIPGFTSISMFPKMWEYSGIPYPKLLDRLIELALERATMRSQTQYARVTGE